MKTNFADIERDAVLADQIKFSVKEEQPKAVENNEDQVCLLQCSNKFIQSMEGSFHPLI